MKVDGEGVRPTRYFGPNSPFRPIDTRRAIGFSRNSLLFSDEYDSGFASSLRKYGIHLATWLAVRDGVFGHRCEKL